jgi:hypothetical protein
VFLVAAAGPIFVLEAFPFWRVHLLAFHSLVRARPGFISVERARVAAPDFFPTSALPFVRFFFSRAAGLRRRWPGSDFHLSALGFASCVSARRRAASRRVSCSPVPISSASTPPRDVSPLRPAQVSVRREVELGLALPFLPQARRRVPVFLFTR